MFKCRIAVFHAAFPPISSMQLIDPRLIHPDTSGIVVVSKMSLNMMTHLRKDFCFEIHYQTCSQSLPKMDMAARLWRRLEEWV
uniref:Uncharacterized protein n=1 Tax=Arion vulgaris TaxID=1028688 RepID=A0A0B7AJK6_9EUPU